VILREVTDRTRRSSVSNQHLYRLSDPEIFYNNKAAVFKTGKLG
jgi:hypothetical protein